jgi:TolB protein
MMNDVRISRRRWLAGAGASTMGLAAAGLVTPGLVTPGLAQQPPAGRQRLPGVVDQFETKPRPIAIPVFLGDDPKFAADVTQVIANNLHNSGLFQVLDPRAYIQRFNDINEPPRYQDWQAVGAEALLVGRAYRNQDGRVQADFRLFDILLSKPTAGQGVRITPQLWRRLGHQIADRVYETLTLEKGYFDTQIVFVDETGPKDRRLKRLTIMDQDGFGARTLTDGRELSLTPRFSPSQQEICFLSYVNQQPRVSLMNLESGQRENLGNLPGLTYAPRFSPDGQRLVFSVQEGAATGLVEMDLRSKQMRRFTQTNGIDTGPCYAPDGRELVFESDREGSQQLYVIELARGGVRRLSRAPGRYSTPVWSPRGDYIAFTKQAEGQFQIGVIKPDGSGERIIADGFHNEGPTWAPNGRRLMFFREDRGAQGGPKLFSVDITGRFERQVPTPAFGSDPAWGPLRA